MHTETNTTVNMVGRLMARSDSDFVRVLSLSSSEIKIVQITTWDSSKFDLPVCPTQQTKE